jgi:hypothetical protein
VCYEKLNYSDENLALAAIELWMREFWVLGFGFFNNL